MLTAKNIKKGDKVSVGDPDGLGTTRARVVEVVNDTTFVVKWLEPRWLLSQNILLNRKGTTSRVTIVALSEPNEV